MSDQIDFPEEGGPEDTLNPSESLDSDEVRNDDGDTVVDPPEHWAVADRIGVTAEEQREGESLDERLAEEEPDVTADLEDVEADVDDDLPGRADHGQISGTPEDGDSFYDVVE